MLDRKVVKVFDPVQKQSLILQKSSVTEIEDSIREEERRMFLNILGKEAERNRSAEIEPIVTMTDCLKAAGGFDRLFDAALAADLEIDEIKQRQESKLQKQKERTGKWNACKRKVAIGGYTTAAAAFLGLVAYAVIEDKKMADQSFSQVTELMRSNQTSDLTQAGYTISGQGEASRNPAAVISIEKDGYTISVQGAAFFEAKKTMAEYFKSRSTNLALRP